MRGLVWEVGGRQMVLTMMARRGFRVFFKCFLWFTESIGGFM